MTIRLMEKPFYPLSDLIATFSSDLSDYDFDIQMHDIGPDGPVSLTTTAMATPSGDSARVSESITRMHAYKLVMRGRIVS